MKPIRISASWTQSYNSGPSMNPAYTRELTAREHLEIIKEIDDRVESMSEYPQAAALLRDLRGV
jgi:hypothetical protein